MGSSAPNGSNSKFMFFTDFDGTITMQDSNDLLVDDLGCGQEARLIRFKGVLEGRDTFRAAFKDILDTIPTSFKDCRQYLLDHIKLDPGFKEFLLFARTQSIPVIILSGGMEPLIRALLSKLVGDEEASHLEILSSNVRARDGKDLWNDTHGWEIAFRDESGHGHDKSVAIRKWSQLPEAERPTLFFAGDGVSDLSAARETDLLFAKQGKDLVKYCVREGIPFTTFDDWTYITKTVKQLVSGENTIENVVAAQAKPELSST